MSVLTDLTPQVIDYLVAQAGISPALGAAPVPGFTEPVQHLLFKWFLPPLALYGVLAAVMRRANQDKPHEHA